MCGVEGGAVLLCVEFAADGEVEFAGAIDAAVAGGKDGLCGDRYYGDRE